MYITMVTFNPKLGNKYYKTHILDHDEGTFLFHQNINCYLLEVKKNKLADFNY